MFLAGVAHPVERHLAKVEVASSSLVTRSIIKTILWDGLYFLYIGGDGSNNSMQQSGGGNTLISALWAEMQRVSSPVPCGNESLSSARIDT